MHPAYQCISESGGVSSSSEDLHPGLIYTSAYYEEEQRYCDIIGTSKECSKHKTSPYVNSAIEINEHSTTNIDLPPILWHGYKNVPKILSLTNTGKTILINGQWVKGRPYIEGGPLNGTYIFSQIHFHSPSEHEIDGKRYPLEMHAVHYKTSYLTQERAMLERDGTVVLVYLFQVLDTPETDFSSVTKLAPKIEKVNSRTETKDVCLEQIVKPFTSNYYVYWGSVETGKHTYLLQWIVNGGIVYVTKQEADELLAIMNFGDVNVKSTPRMKPEDNAIYYVEEVEEEEKEEKEEKQEHDCHACRSYQEWWLSQLSQTCSNYEKDDHEKVSSLNLQYCVSKKEEDCLSQPVLSFKKNFFPRKNFSGLRICCHKIRKPIRKSCETKPVPVCITEDIKICVCPGPGHLENCKLYKVVPAEEGCKKYEVVPAEEDCKKNNGVIVEEDCKTYEVVPVDEDCKTYEVVPAKETTSCPTTEAQLPECKEEPPCEEDVKVKVVCSLPSVKNCPKECADEIEVKIKKKKKTGSCKEVCKDTSKTQTNKKKETKKKNQKKESCEVVPPAKRWSSVKREKKPPPKRTRKSDPDCEASKSNSRASTSTKRLRKRESRDFPDACREKEIPVECIVSTLTEKSFDEILREYDTAWLDDSNLKMFIKTDSDNSADVVSLKKPPHDEDTITTLFEKKRERKVLDRRPAEDCTVDFLLQPNSHKSNPSSSYMSPKSISEEIKCIENKVSNKGVNVPDITVNTVTLSGVRIPTENPNELPKEFCVQVELLFHANNKDFSECVTQEYNLALMYNQNILQEYRGTLCPNNLQIGNYEKLELLPKYPELDNISIRLQDCTVKMESSDQICMRAKFLMKELNFKNLDTIGEHEGEENTDKKLLVLSDAVTQCSVKEFNRPTDFDILEKISLQAKVSEVPQRSFPEEHTSLRNSVNLSTPKCQLSKQSLEPGSLKNEKFEKKKSEVSAKLKENTPMEEGEDSEETNYSEKEAFSRCPEETCKKLNCLEEENISTNCTDGNNVNLCSLGEAIIKEDGEEAEEAAEEVAEEGGKKEKLGKEFSKLAVKKLKNIFPNRKKTVYFTYEKVEIDEKSGKKVFVGSFRSKDDVKHLPTEKKSTRRVDNEEGKKLLLLSVKESMGSYDFVPVFNGNEQDLKTDNPSERNNFLNDKKDLVTLHKFKPKHLEVHDSKKDRLNVVVGKSLNQVQKNSKHFKRLADLVGVDQKENSKISVYELQESSQNKMDEDPTSFTEVKDRPTERDPSNMLVSKKLSNKNVKGKPSATASAVARKVSDKSPAKNRSFTLVSKKLSGKNMKEKQSATESVEGRKVLTKKGSQSAVIIIPVEVESLSKVEVILVEHSDSTRKTVLKRGKEITPCLDSP